MLTEKCENNNCEAQLSNTTINSTVISYMTQEIKNGNFDDIFQENADVICAETTCPQVKNGEVVGGAFNETKRGQVVVPIEAPSANPTTLTPTSSQPTAVGPSVAPLELPTAAPTNSPSSVPTKVPSANPTTKMSIFFSTNNRQFISCTFGTSNSSTFGISNVSSNRSTPRLSQLMALTTM